jgi:copper chaperone
MCGAAPREHQMDSLHLDIQGMTCGHCVGAVRRSLEGLAGVSVNSVSIGSADVSFDPAMTDREAILNAVSEEGYAAHASVASTS